MISALHVYLVKAVLGTSGVYIGMVKLMYCNHYEEPGRYLVEASMKVYDDKITVTLYCPKDGASIGGYTIPLLKAKESTENKVSPNTQTSS